MGLYDTLNLVHVLASIVWLGGALVTQAYIIRMKTAEPGHRLGFARDVAFVGQWIYTPAALVVLVLGFWMVVDRDAYDFSQAWILIGLLGLIAAVGLANAVIIPQTRKAIGLMEAGNGPAAGAVIRTVGMVSRLTTAILVVAVWAMVFKPGLGSSTSVLFPTLLVIHILAVMLWLGGGFISFIFLRRSGRADHVHRLGFAEDIMKIGPMFGASAGVAAITGIWMVAIWPDYDFNQAWVIIGIAGLLLSSLLGGVILTPVEKRFHAEVVAGGDAAEPRRQIVRLVLLDHLLLVIVVWAMVFRPGA